ncbi:MAG: hypothetical protein U0514_03325 [Candidatus Andersenbacteria bacterium]
MLRFASGRDLVDVGGQPGRLCCLLVRRLQIAHAARRTAPCIFRNHGPRAGASLALPHHQLYAMPVQSPEEQSELAWVRTLRSCPTCSLQRASSARRFWVASRPGATLLARPAARWGQCSSYRAVTLASFAELRTAEQEDVVALVALGVRRLLLFGDVGLNEEEWLERVTACTSASSCCAAHQRHRRVGARGRSTSTLPARAHGAAAAGATLCQDQAVALVRPVRPASSSVRSAPGRWALPTCNTFNLESDLGDSARRGATERAPVVLKSLSVRSSTVGERPLLRRYTLASQERGARGAALRPR